MIVIFHLQASSKDAGQLAAALHHRILALRSRAEQEAESTPEPPHAEITQSNEDDSDDDDELAKNNSSIAPTGNTTASGTPNTFLVLTSLQIIHMYTLYTTEQLILISFFRSC